MAKESELPGFYMEHRKFNAVSLYNKAIEELWAKVDYSYLVHPDPHISLEEKGRFAQMNEQSRQCLNALEYITQDLPDHLTIEEHMGFNAENCFISLKKIYECFKSFNIPFSRIK